MDRNGGESSVSLDRDFDEKEDEERKIKRKRERERKNSLFISPRAPSCRATSGSKTDTDPHEENSKH